MIIEDDEEEPQIEQQRRLRRFKWFVAGLTLFCLFMIFWLPR